MTSVGVMASSVVSGVCTPVLREPFDNLAAWALTGTQAIVAGRTGTGASLNASPASNFARYTIPSPSQSPYLTLGFAFRISNATGTRAICRLESDSGAVIHEYVQVLTTGVLEVRVGGVGGVLLAATAAGVIPINTYVYIELQAFLHDTLGSITVNVNGVQVAAATNVDTKNAGTKTVFDTVCLLAPASGITNIFDDLYLTTGAGCAFQGDQTIVNTGPDVLLEPFYNFTAWVVANAPTIVAGGRTGNGAQFVGTAVTPMLTFTVPAPSESDTVTIGFAFKATSFGLATTPMVELRSDAGATLHTQLSLNSSGQIVVSRSGISIGAGAHGMTAGAFSYIEWQVRLHDTLGTAIVRINGVEVLNLTGLDTRNAGTKAVYDTVRLLGTASGVTTVFDDLYITMGAGAPFKGSITIP